MFQDIFQEYVNETCPELTNKEKQKLVFNLTRMARTWGDQSELPPEVRTKGLEQATKRIALEFGAAPRSFHMSFRCSTKNKTVDEIRVGAQAYLRLFTENLNPSSKNDGPNDSFAPQYKVDEITVESPRMALVKTSIEARVGRSADLRRAADRASRRRKLPVSYIYYPQLSLFETAETLKSGSFSSLAR